MQWPDTQARYASCRSFYSSLRACVHEPSFTCRHILYIATPAFLAAQSPWFQQILIACCMEAEAAKHPSLAATLHTVLQDHNSTTSERQTAHPKQCSDGAGGWRVLRGQPGPPEQGLVFWRPRIVSSWQPLHMCVVPQQNLHRTGLLFIRDRR